MALSLHNLQKSYGRHSVLRGVDLQVDAGNIHGLVGLNGAGKTTTLQCLLGLQPFNNGDIKVLGYEPKHLYRSAGKVAAVFDQPCLHPDLTVRRALEYAQLTCGNPEPLAAALIEQQLGIERYRDFKIKQLSLGNQRRASIGQALIGQPQLLILDEPFNGLDAGGVEDVLELIRTLNQSQGTTFLLASHQLGYLQQVCSHMAFLHEGSMVVNSSVEALLADHSERITLQTPDTSLALSTLSNIKGVELIDDNHHKITLALNGISSGEVNRQLVLAGVEVSELQRYKHSLEAVFHRLTKGSTETTAAAQKPEAIAEGSAA